MSDQTNIDMATEASELPARSEQPASAESLPPAEEAQAAPCEAVSNPALTQQQFEELQAKAAKADEHWNRYVRASADLENFRKRAAREKQEAGRNAVESVLVKLVPVLDNFDVALAAAASSNGATIESFRTGVAMIGSQLKSALGEIGLEEIDAAGKVFDPNWHEAVSQQECPTTPEGQVLQQLRKGYKFRDRLLRPAGVIVARQPATAAGVVAN
jgi:molecular chaperone GrpE